MAAAAACACAEAAIDREPSNARAAAATRAAREGAKVRKDDVMLKLT
jgi:hypothetical protein